MLVLKREKDGVIRIGDDITVTVVAIGPGWVKLGVEAPKAIPVHRQEVYEKIHGNEPKGDQL